MSDATNTIYVTAEVLTSLRLCNVTVLWPKPLTGVVKDVEATRDIISIINSDGRPLNIHMPSSITLHPGLLNYKIVENKYLQMRVTLGRLNDTKTILKNITDEMATLTFIEPSLKDSLTDAYVMLVCAECSQAVSKSLTLKKVLPLPFSENWDSVVEGFYCHAHGPDIEKLKTTANSPQPSDCFYSEMCFLVAKEMVTNTSTDENSLNVSCLHCGNILGVLDKMGVRLWRHEVEWWAGKNETSDSGAEKEASANNDINKRLFSQSIQKNIVAVIDDIVFDEFSHNCRVVFVRPGSPKMFLYISVLNGNMMHYASSAVTDDRFVPVTPDIPSTTRRSSPTSKSIEHMGDVNEYEIHENDTKKIKLSPIEFHLQRRNVIEVLYKVVEGETDETELWNEDIYVQIFNCSSKFFDTVADMLKTSSKTLPESSLDDEINLGFIDRQC